ELPWSNLKVRQALVMAIDFNAIIKDYYKGKAELLAYPLVPWPEFLPMFTPIEKQNDVVRDMFTYQPEKAKKILADAGYPKGFNISVLTTSVFTDDLSIIKFYWEQIGVNMQIDVRENAVFTSISEGKQHKEAVGQTVNTVPFNLEQYQPVTTSNVNNINDPYLNKTNLAIAADYLFNEPKVWQMQKEFFQYVLEQAYNISLPGPYLYNMWQPWVKNYHGEHYSGGRGIWLFATTYSWIDQALKKSMGF
ncbi:MAG: hypothetical protein HY529_02190, partial [Chloroflexi bacterium]|nr:hypothetical protein [Chloroflexota bacterium]